MSNVETKTQEYKGTVSILDAWLNSFKEFQSYQTEIAEKSLQHLQTQRNILYTTRETLDKIEEDKTKIEDECKDALENKIKSIKNEEIERLFSTWINQIEEINNSAKEISGLSNQAVLDLFTQSQLHLEHSVKKALEQQQKKSDEVYKQIELLTEQIKKAYKE